MRILAGTSGLSCREWKGSSYPAKLPADRMLAHHAARLPAYPRLRALLRPARRTARPGLRRLLHRGPAPERDGPGHDLDHGPRGLPQDQRDPRRGPRRARRAAAAGPGPRGLPGPAARGDRRRGDRDRDAALLPAGGLARRGELLEALRALAARHHPGVPVTTPLAVGFTDCHWFRERGIPCYGFAPFAVDDDDMSRFHGNDERLSVQNLRFGTRFTVELLERLAALPQEESR